jgi:small subunit ribosomal protein S4
MKLFLKGTRCNTPKCAYERRQTPPGMHGRGRQKRTEYGTQLREKQKLRRAYGVLERQFRLYFQRANQRKGITGEVLLQMLEQRLDNVVYRAGFATSRAQARQMVNHSLITVNGRKVNIASFQVREGDVIGCRSREATTGNVKATLAELGEAYIAPAWLEVDREKVEATVTRLPGRDDISIPINESLIVELYSK